MHKEISFFDEIFLNTIEYLFTQVTPIVKYLGMVIDLHMHQQLQKCANIELTSIQRYTPQQPIFLLQNCGLSSFFISIGLFKYEMLIPQTYYQPIFLIIINSNQEMLCFEQQKLMIFLDTGQSSKEGYNWIYWFVKLFRSYLHLYDPYAFQFL